MNGARAMTHAFDSNRFDDIVLALLWANSFKEPGGLRAWKSLDWDALDRLHQRGLISNPRSRAHSVTLSDEAFERGRNLFEHWFGRAATGEPAGKPAARAQALHSAAPARTVHQFRIILDGISPMIWRRIQLPSDSTFWDLHCAINDATGWEDAHLHRFHVGGKRGGVEIGIPMDEMLRSDTLMLADWEVPIATYFDKPGTRGGYLYDFGDDWNHQVILEAIVPREAGAKYPRCTDGARACPPEDCGGLPGYERICAIFSEPGSADAEAGELMEWVGEDFDPDRFDLAKVRFRSAKRRLKALLDAR